jgi:two-component system sensor histidine kinase TctE
VFPSTSSIRRRLLIFLLPPLLLVMLAGAFVSYRAAVLVARSVHDHRSAAVEAAAGTRGAADREPIRPGRDAIDAGSERFILASTWLTAFVEVDLALLLVWLAVHVGLKPLRAVRDQIESRSPRDLRPLDASDVPFEVRPLVDTLNVLFDLLRETAHAQRQFVADAAHQLRTPIAGLTGHLELLVREPTAAPIRDRLEALHDGMARLSHSANQLLALARTDPSAGLADTLETVDLAALIARVIESNLDRASASRHDLGAETRPAAVEGSARLLEDLLGNLIDNALSYTPAGSRVTARCAIAAGKPFLEVEDDGPGIPAAQRAQVRRRFYRIPGTQGRGCGLGLAIVDEIAHLHHARLHLAEGAGGRGTLARVEFSTLSPHRDTKPLPSPRAKLRIASHSG